jgi:glyoxylase-like metal-dependent hydrolase (beta-lactamase superfamily II)
MNFLERVDNVCLIDTKMFGFEKYMSAYIVAGEEIALIDTGLRTQLDAVLAGIKACGFSPGDISRIFVTHSHPDHNGNVAPLLKENPRAKVYVHPLGVEQLIDPSIELVIREKALPPEMHARIGEMEPVSPDRIQVVNDGDVFDLGGGERLTVYYAPGHQPDGIVLYEEKNQGLFINDLVGNYLPDAEAHYPLNPPNSDHTQAIASLKRLLDLPVKYLYLGHYGICENPREIMERAIDKMQQLLDIGTTFMREGKAAQIAGEVYGTIMPELEKLRTTRGEEVYRYAADDHIASQAKLFAQFCQEKLNE